MTPTDIAGLLADAERRFLAGDAAGAAPLFEQAAGIFAERGAARDEANALLTAARVRLMLGQAAAAATLLDRADAPAARAGITAEVLHVRGELADERGDPAARRRAWRAHADAVEGGAAVTALRRLAAAEQAAGDGRAAVVSLAEAERTARAAGLDEIAVECAFEQAALALASRAIDTAEGVLGRLAPGLPTDAHPHRVRWFQQRAMVAHARGEADAAIEYALSARSLAVGCTDVQGYLASCMLLFGVYDDVGRRVDAYDTLVRARESLKDILGPGAHDLVQPALDAFTRRIGDVETDRVHRAWVERRKAGR